jgi:hypothetical protein
MAAPRGSGCICNGLRAACVSVRGEPDKGREVATKGERRDKAVIRRRRYRKAKANDPSCKIKRSFHSPKTTVLNRNKLEYSRVFSYIFYVF